MATDRCSQHPPQPPHLSTTGGLEKSRALANLAILVLLERHPALFEEIDSRKDGSIDEAEFFFMVEFVVGK